MINYLDDLEADFRVFYRIEDIWSLPAPQFFKLAYRVGAYGGVISARYAAQQEEETPQVAVAGRDNDIPLAPSDFRAKAMAKGKEVKEVPLSTLMMTHGDLFQVG